MSRLEDMRIITQRLLGGTYRPEEMQQLMLWVRGAKYVKPSVKEIGDFIGHSEEKKKGIVTKELRDHFKAVRWRLSFYYPKPRPWNPDNLPDNFKEMLSQNFSKIGEEMIRLRFPFGKEHAERILNEILADIKKIDGKLKFRKAFTTLNIGFIDFCIDPSLRAPCFTSEQFMSELQYTLHRSGLLEEVDFPRFAAISKPLTLFAIAAMHKTEIVTGPNQKATLHASIHGNFICVDAYFDLQDVLKDSEYRCIVFSTGFDYHDCFNPSLDFNTDNFPRRPNVIQVHSSLRFREDSMLTKFE